MVIDIGLCLGGATAAYSRLRASFGNGTASAIASAVRRWEAQISKN